MEKEKKLTLAERFGEYKAEFKRIQWLTAEELRKKTLIVIGLCLVFLAIIFVYDYTFTELMIWVSRIVA
jgi:preprotein translocase SecE subunit